MVEKFLQLTSEAYLSTPTKLRSALVIVDANYRTRQLRTGYQVNIFQHTNGQ